MLTSMVGYETSYEISADLEAYFAAQTQVKLGQQKSQLQNIKKGDPSTNDY